MDINAIGSVMGRVGALLVATAVALVAGEGNQSTVDVEPHQVVLGIIIVMTYLLTVLALARQGKCHVFHGYTDVVITSISAALWMIVVPSAWDLATGTVVGPAWWQAFWITLIFIGIPLVFSWVANRSLIVALLVLPAKLLVGVGVCFCVMTTLSEAAKAKEELDKGKTGAALLSGAKAVVAGAATAGLLGFLRTLMPPRNRPAAVADT